MSRYNKILEASIAEYKIRIAELQDVLAQFKKIYKEAQSDKESRIYDKAYVIGIKSSEQLVRGRIFIFRQLIKKLEAERKRRRTRKKKVAQVQQKTAISSMVGGGQSVVPEGSNKHRMFMEVFKALATRGKGSVPIDNLLAAVMMTGKFDNVEEVRRYLEEAQSDGVLFEIRPGIVTMSNRMNEKWVSHK